MFLSEFECPTDPNYTSVMEPIIFEDTLIKAENEEEDFDFLPCRKVHWKKLTVGCQVVINICFLGNLAYFNLEVCTSLANSKNVEGRKTLFCPLQQPGGHLDPRPHINM